MTASTSRNTYKPSKRKKQKNRRTDGTFLMLTHNVIRSKEFGNISAHSTKLLIELASLYNNKNNGDLSASYRVLKERGWKSSSTLNASLKELEKNGWIIKTRQGGRNQCSLYAITWWRIDDCNGKHFCNSTQVACNSWRKN